MSCGVTYVEYAWLGRFFQIYMLCSNEVAVKHKLDKSWQRIGEIAETAYSSDDFDFPLCKRMPLTRLSVVVYLPAQKYTEYESIGVASDIIVDTFRDASLRANLYYKQRGNIGVSKVDVIWFRHILHHKKGSPLRVVPMVAEKDADGGITPKSRPKGGPKPQPSEAVAVWKGGAAE